MACDGVRCDRQHVGLRQLHQLHVIEVECGRVQSPIAVLKQARLSKARHLLAEADLSMEAIARACGYTSTNHFFQQFKNELGTTPLGYKEHPDNLTPNHPD